MSTRGTYTPLRGGTLFSRPPWGGAPDPTADGWAYRGPRAFHGHEAPTFFSRRGGWPPRRDAPLGRGRLIVSSGLNDRGSYGARVGSNAEAPANEGTVAEGVRDAWTFVKVGAWTALGIGAIAALSSIVTNVRKGEDPAQKWLQYVGRRPRVAEVAA